MTFEMNLATLASMIGRKVLLTGATGGLGKIFADTLAGLGAELLLVDQPGTELDRLAADLRMKYGVATHVYFCDLEDQTQRQELVDQVLISGKLNALINNAAFVGSSNLEGWSVPFQEQSVETWRRALEVNLTAVFHLCQGLFPLLEKCEGGNIVNIGSIYSDFAPDWSLYEGTSIANPAAYGASKAGLVQLTKWLSTTLSPKIRVNSISPGGIFRNQPKIFVERYSARTPLKRMANENDFRGTIAFLVSDMSAYITGQNIKVDGGWGVW